MAFHPNFTQLGQLKIIEIYEYYDKPLLFACRNTAGQLFLTVLVDETDREEIWYYVSVSQKRFEQIRSGGMDLHDAFSRAEDNQIYKITVPYDQNSRVELEYIFIDNLTDDNLPLKGEKLDLYTQTLPTATSLEQLQTKAVQSLREQIILHLTLPDIKRTEAPAELLGEVLRRFQQLLTAVSNSLRENVKAKGVGITPQVNVQNFAHASFAVELSSDALVDLFKDSDTGRVLEKIVELIQIGNDPEGLKLKIEELKPRVAVNYALFLKSFDRVAVQTRIDWASPKEQERVHSVSITAQEAKDIIDTIEKTELAPPINIIISGTLIGANLRSKTFEISSIEEERYKKYAGRIDDDYIDHIKGIALGEDYRATIVQTLAINYTTGKAEPKYMLMNLEDIT